MLMKAIRWGVTEVIHLLLEAKPELNLQHKVKCVLVICKIICCCNKSQVPKACDAQGQSNFILETY